MQSCIDTYKHARKTERENIEFEYKLGSVSRDVFDRVYTEIRKLHGDPVITYEVDASYPASKTRKNVMTYVYNHSMVVPTHTWYKEQICRHDNMTDKITVSKEVAEHISMVGKDLHYRFKTRASFTIKNWRVDMTFVGTEKHQTVRKCLRLMYDRYFDRRTADTFVSVTTPVNSRNEIEFEHVGDPQTIEFSETDSLFSIIDPMYMATKDVGYAVTVVAEKLGFKGNYARLRDLLKQPVGLSRTTYGKVWPLDGYMVTAKADGDRALVHVTDNKAIVITTTVRTYECDLDDIIFEGELMGNVLYSFDVLWHKGQSVMSMPLAERIKLLSSAKLDGLAIIPKPYVTVDPDVNVFRDVYSKTSFQVDGLIIAENAAWGIGKTYKWKDVTQMTIDFGVIADRNGKYMLVCTAGKTQTFEGRVAYDGMPQGFHLVKFAVKGYPNLWRLESSEKDLHGKVVEALYSDSTWKIIKIRDDKTITGKGPNNIAVAIDTFLDGQNPLGLDDLMLPPTASYFNIDVDDIYVAGNRAKRFAIDQVLASIAKCNTNAIDIAGGRGADGPRLEQAGYKTITVLDSDLDALKVYTQRIKTATVRTRHVNLNSSITTIRPMITTCNGLALCNFAIHYFCDTVTHIGNIVKLIGESLAPGGSAIITYMDGASIHAAVRTGSYDSGDGKYHIDGKLGPKLLNVGQEISVKLGFSREMISEYLVNETYLKSLMTKNGLVVDKAVSMYTFLPNLERHEYHTFQKLSEDDKQYIKMHHIMLVHKPSQ